MKHVISAGDFTRESIERVLASAETLRPIWESRQPREALTDIGVVRLLFAEASTRTAGSFEEAARLCGMPSALTAGADATSLIKGETLGHTGRMYHGQNAWALVMRTKIEGGARWVAEMATRYGLNLCVLNAGDGANEHPSQTLLDLSTIKRRLGRLDRFRIGIVGDLRLSRTVHSFIRALRLLDNIEIILVSTPESRLQWWYTEGMTNVTVADSLEALVGCDFVYTTRIQRERFPADGYESKRVRGRYVIDEAVLKMLGGKTLIMHPLPIGDGEIHSGILMHPQVIVDEQAANGISIRMALLQMALAGQEDVTELDTCEPEVEVIRSVSAQESIARKDAEDRRFLPIPHGTVLDHLPVGTGDHIKKVLGCDPAKSYVGHDGGLRTREPVVKKDTLRLENRFLTPGELSIIGVLVPDVTVNSIRDGVITKSKIRRVPEVTGIGHCPNPACVTNHDAEAALFPHFHVHGEDRGVLTCHYCEQYFDRAEVLA